MCVSWHDDLSDVERDQRDIRIEDNTPDGYTGEVFYPDCTIDDLCRAIDDATAVWGRLADETHELTRLIERRAA